MVLTDTWLSNVEGNTVKWLMCVWITDTPDTPALETIEEQEGVWGVNKEQTEIHKVIIKFIYSPIFNVLW